MGIIEILLISIGLSFDVFVVHICVGAGFSRKHGKDTLLSSLIFGGMQLFALILGNVVADILKPDRKMNETISTAASGWELLSVLIFIGLGIYMICKARNNKQIFERRNDEINWKRLRKLAVLTRRCVFCRNGYRILECGDPGTGNGIASGYDHSVLSWCGGRI